MIPMTVLMQSQQRKLIFMKKNKHNHNEIVSSYVKESPKATVKYFNVLNQPGIINPKYIPDIPAQMITDAATSK